MKRAVVLLALAACHRHTGTLEIPTTTMPIHVDGEWNERDWSGRSLRGQFLGDDHQLSRPTSEVRWLRDDRFLYVGLYAADDDIRSTDAFELAIGDHKWSVSALGVVTPPIEGSTIGVDRDGSVDDASNNDEEWLIELAIPIAATGLESGKAVPVTASRCDVPKHQAKRCAAWSHAVTVR
ncbi:MAG TPA: hypothetical protein VGG28_11120 [Kofleriaceae bacterium]